MIGVRDSALDVAHGCNHGCAVAATGSALRRYFYGYPLPPRHASCSTPLLGAMLRSLDIRDMLLIDRLELDFQPGLNVLTGETGAGKSILLDCLGFVLGWRGRADLVRAGAAQGEGPTTFVLGGSGHIAGVINPPGKRQKYGYWTDDSYPADPDAWLAAAEKHEGSWWPHWAKWIEGNSPATMVPAYDPATGGLKPIEPAPGSYVKAD